MFIFLPYTGYRYDHTDSLTIQKMLQAITTCIEFNRDVRILQCNRILAYKKPSIFVWNSILTLECCIVIDAIKSLPTEHVCIDTNPDVAILLCNRWNQILSYRKCKKSSTCIELKISIQNWGLQSFFLRVLAQDRIQFSNRFNLSEDFLTA